jgi:hypothetical protein
MLSQDEKKTVRSFMATRKIIATPAPVPKQRTQGKTVIARRTPPKKLEPYVLQVTILHVPDETDNDVIFAHKGDCPKDIDANDLEQYIADYFGTDEDEDEEYCDVDGDEFEE